MSGNKYEATLNQTWELFGNFICGKRDGLFCILSRQDPHETAQKALLSTAKSLGYNESVTNVVTNELDANALFMLIEGLDPNCIVVTEGPASNMLKSAYNSNADNNTVCRLLGRTCVLFENFDIMLKSTHDKQRAWALLKQLPRLNT